jgi:hypothetical protein
VRQSGDRVSQYCPVPPPPAQRENRCICAIIKRTTTGSVGVRDRE